MRLVSNNEFYQKTKVMVKLTEKRKLRFIGYLLRKTVSKLFQKKLNWPDAINERSRISREELCDELIQCLLYLTHDSSASTTGVRIESMLPLTINVTNMLLGRTVQQPNTTRLYCIGNERTHTLNTHHNSIKYWAFCCKHSKPNRLTGNRGMVKSNLLIICDFSFRSNELRVPR